MTLTANRDLDRYVDQELRVRPVRGGERIYRGAFVGLDPRGMARPVSEGDRFAGIAYEEIDGSDAEDGDKSIRVFTSGDFEHTLIGVDPTDINRSVFAVDDETLTLDPVGPRVGSVAAVLGQGAIVLRLHTVQPRLQSLSYIVEDLARGQNLAARAIAAVAVDGWLESALLINQQTPAAGIDNGNPCIVSLESNGSVLAEVRFDGDNPFPVPNSFAPIHIDVARLVRSGEVITLRVSNGANADPGTFLIQVNLA